MRAEKMPARRRLRRSFLVSLLVACLLAHVALAASPCDVSYPSDEKVPWECRRVARGETLESLFGQRWVDIARFNRIDRRHVTPGTRIRSPLSTESVRDFSPMPARYEGAETEDKLVLIDLTEQFAGAYERGTLVFSVPVASGRPTHPTPAGEYRITAFHRDHESSLYPVEGTKRPYPMHYGLRFLTTPAGVSYWVHGRDLPGHPASHGCVGLYDEAMQRQVYGQPREPWLADARRLYEWVIGDVRDDGRLVEIEGPRLLIIGREPRVGR